MREMTVEEPKVAFCVGCRWPFQLGHEHRCPVFTFGLWSVLFAYHALAPSAS